MGTSTGWRIFTVGPVLREAGPHHREGNPEKTTRRRVRSLSSPYATHHTQPRFSQNTWLSAAAYTDVQNPHRCKGAEIRYLCCCLVACGSHPFGEFVVHHVSPR